MLSLLDRAYAVNVISSSQTVNHLKILMAKARVNLRKKDPGKKKKRKHLRAKPKGSCVEELTEEEWDGSGGAGEVGPGSTGEEWLEGEDDFDFGQNLEDNLTYHEDSLSVMKGEIETTLGEGIPIWITTDSGSMTQLVQADYVRRLKIPIAPLPEGKRFSIEGPGGGKDQVENYARLKVKIRMKKYLGEEDSSYDELPSQEEEKQVSLTFGVCDSLPVPILWGGAQMRKHDLVDYHSRKLLTMRLPEGQRPRYATESTSWLVAAAEMGALEDRRLARAYRPFVLSPDRLANMVKGERKTINLPAILYPGRDNIVRVARHNARIDEGLNEVVLKNREAIEERYGQWLVVIDSVANGEAFIIVRNNSSQAISLAPGTLEIAIRPTVTLPSIVKMSELDRIEGSDEDQDLFEGVKSLAVRTEHEQLERALERDNSPSSFMTWNCNGLAVRMKAEDIDARFYDEIMMASPDIVSIQEVRMACAEGQPHKVAPGTTDEARWEAFMEPLQGEYVAYLTLSHAKYGGQAVLVKRSLARPVVTYHLDGDDVEHSHHPDGRFMKLEFPDIVVRSVYAPFNGVGKDHHLKRRQKWDAAMLREMSKEAKPGQGRVLMGDLNVAYQDSDLSPHPDFWLKQGPQDGPIGDRGFGGTTRNERERFKEIMDAGEMADTFTPPSGRRHRARWTFRGKGKMFGKGMKVDYIMVDDTIMLSGGVKTARILDNGLDREGFMGSDHAPVTCELHPRWKAKRASLKAYYEAGDKKVTREEKRNLAVMFSRVAANGGVAKARADPAVRRPVEFPEDFWKYVHPDDKVEVANRFDQFKSREYLQECIKAVVEKLDIEDREEYFMPEWKPDSDTEDWRQERVLRAQAIANLDIYFFPNPDKVAMAKGVLAEIETISNKPHNCRARKLSVVQQAFLQAKTNIMIRMGQLEEAQSDWNHGLVLVAYEDRINKFMAEHGDQAMTKMFLPEHELEVATFFRLCVDLRMLNSRTIPDRFPLPRIDDLLESIPRGCARFSISDIADAFFKCELKKEDRHKTAFKTHNRHLQFAVLPQGFINSPSVFCRLIARTFEGMKRHRFSAYIDDVLNHTDDFGEHLATQKDLYDRLRESQLTLKLSKTHLNYSTVKFLGHILTKEGRLPDPEAVEAIQQWKDPTTAKEVRSFLGATLYYREYIYNYSDMAMPLYELIKKGVIVEKAWDPGRHPAAVQGIKDALTSRPVLMQVDNTKPFRLKVDACRRGRGIGGILEQQNAEEKWQPVSYYSAALSKEERDYSATELECKALHDCIMRYAVYLKHIPHFEVFSDHNALRYMVSSDNAVTNGRLMRYLLNLQEYNFTIYYRKGVENCDADAVSRLTRTTDQPVILTEDELDKESGVISRNMLQRARALDKRNARTEKEARRLLRQIAKTNLQEMSILNDHILSEGVENLESESGRARFLKNLQDNGLSCTRTQLEETLEHMREDRGPSSKGSEEINPDEDRFAKAICSSGGGITAATEMPIQVENDWESKERTQKEETEVAELPVMLANMVSRVRQDLAVHGGLEGRRDLDVEELEERRQEIRDRVLQESRNTTRDNRRTLVVTRTGLKIAEDQPDCEDEVDPKETQRLAKKLRKKLRKRLQQEGLYVQEEKTQPNWQRDVTEPPERHPANAKLERKRKLGYGKVEVRKSLMAGESGWGLFTTQRIKKGQVICSYEGVQLTAEKAEEEGASRDYVASAIKDHRTGEMVYIDGEKEDSCYGRFSQDPIEDSLVNSKILWKGGKMVLVAAADLDQADEVLTDYGIEYWRYRLHLLHPEARRRIRDRLGGRRVQFSPEVTIATYTDTAVGRRGRMVKVESEGMPLEHPIDRREEEPNAEEGHENGIGCGPPIPPEDMEMLDLNNVDECEELADRLYFLNGRKFYDEGRLYEIFQVQYDPKSRHIIGFRKPLSGRTRPEDGVPFMVYGLEGLYELSERYYQLHPEKRFTVEWPRNATAWAELQREDNGLTEIIFDVECADGRHLDFGRDSFALKDTEEGKPPMLVREVDDRRKGKLIQAVVPRTLINQVLEYHHEGYGHMGANRMLETIRLRYYWPHMDRDIANHSKECVNCKLRKSYQRRPKVPIMKYDDTSRPLDRVHVDLTGPLPKTKAGHLYVMVIKDYLTKYVWLVPLKSKGAVEIAEAFVGEFICQAGVPGRVVSDRGNEFVNRLLSNVSRILCINRISTTPYNPRSDGFVENHNKTLKDQLFHYVDTLKQDDWDVYLPTVQLMYNTTVSLATGFTPMLLMTGREARMPSFNHMDSVDLEREKSVLSNEYVLKTIETMRAYQDFALKQTERNKERLNVRVRRPLEFVEYEEGQKFMKTKRPVSTFKSADEEEAWKVSMKLMERWEGPYTVIRKISPVLYDADVDGKEERVHAINMKPF